MICDFEISKIVFEYCRLIPEKHDGWILNFFYNWQTLIAGSFALIGGGLLAWQIAIQKDEINRQKERDLIAARVKLPHALSEVHKYLEDIFNLWLIKENDNIPHLSPDTLDVLVKMASVADKNTFTTLKNLIAYLQSSPAKWENKRAINCFDYMIKDVAYLLFINNRLYDYGRFVKDSIPYHEPSETELNKSLDDHFLRDTVTMKCAIVRARTALRY